MPRNKEDTNSTAIPIYAAISPRGEIIKSSIGTFRIHAHRFAKQYKNFTVVKLAEINPEIVGIKKVEVPEVVPQILDAKIEAPNADKPIRRRRRKLAAAE